ncbi:MAG: hypothetical protein ACLFPE_14360 [Bacteroidales bacterium]
MKKQMATFLTMILIGVFSHGLIAGNEVKIVKNNLPAELAGAAATGTNTIMVITDNNESGLAEAMTLANETAALCSNAMVAVLNRDLEENMPLLNQYQLTRFPAPYVVILSPAGYIAGGVVPGKITADKLAKYVPSKCYNDVLTARTQKKAVYALVYNQQDESYNKYLEVLKESKSSLDPSPEIITVQAADQDEQSFLSRIGYQLSEEPVVIVINPVGQISGKFNSVPTCNDLIKATSTMVSRDFGSSSGGSGCCPSSKSCSPKEKASCGSK